MNSRRVTIIIPTFKRSDRIRRAIVSALEQKYNNFEVIVVDDNNPGSYHRIETERIVAEFKGLENFRYIQHPKNLNGSAARNTGIQNSTGDFITFLDDDDEYYPNKIFEQAKQLDSIDESWAMTYSEYDKIVGSKILSSSEKAEGNLLTQVLSKNLFIGSGSNFMVRKSVVDELNGFDVSFRRNQDLEFMVRVAKKYKIKFLPKKLFLIHSEINDKDYSFSDILEIHKQYRVNFQDIIDSLETEERNDVLKMLDLWDIRLAISKRKIKMAYGFWRNSELTYSEIFDYILYLLKRFITGTSYGFVLKK